MGGRWKLLTGPDTGSINDKTAAGYVPFQAYAVGYATGFPFKSSVKGAILASWGTTCQAVNAELAGLVEDQLDPQASVELPGLRTLQESCTGGMDCRSGCLFDID